MGNSLHKLIENIENGKMKSPFIASKTFMDKHRNKICADLKRCVVFSVPDTAPSVMTFSEASFRIPFRDIFIEQDSGYSCYIKVGEDLIYFFMFGGEDVFYSAATYRGEYNLKFMKGTYFNNTDIDELRKLVGSFVNWILIINAKNIVALEEKPPEKLQKKRIKKGKQQLFSTHTLHVTRNYSGSEQKFQLLGEKNAPRVHLCRGHFATYGENGRKKLFGKYSGTFWIPAHARGNKKNGIIDKDYRID